VVAMLRHRLLPQQGPNRSEDSPPPEPSSPEGGMLAASGPLMRWLAEPTPLPQSLERLKESIHAQLVEEVDAKSLDPEGARRLVREVATELLAQRDDRGIAEFRERLLNEICDEVLGFSVLE